MIRLIIADDEEYERTYLSRFIEENYADVIRIVFAARDGAELVERAAALKPDLILMDIRMPRMDGLEAAAQIKHMLPRTEIVILSAYDQFSYAKRAIQLGVRDFLVKPYLNEELTDTINGLMASLDSAVPAADSGPDRREWQSGADSELVWDLTFDRRKEDSLHRELFASGIEGGAFKCLTFFHAGICRLGGAGRKIIQRFFAKPAFQVVTGDLFCLLVVYLFSDEEIAYSEMNTAIRRTKEYLAGLDPAPVFCGVSGVCHRLSDTGHAFKEASAYIEDYSAGDTHEQFCRVLNDVRNACDLTQRMKFFILNRSHRQAQECAALQFELYSRYAAGDKDTLSAMLQRLLFTLLHDLDGGSPDGFDRLLSMCAENVRDSRLLLERGLDFLEQEAEKQPAISGNTQIVRKAKSYLTEHYSEPLGLKEVADVLGVSAGYLSKCFKAHGGNSFTEYLTDVRLEAAKRMMRESDRSISDISYAVGFSDPGYFSKCFRKRENLSPSEYAAIQHMERP